MASGFHDFIAGEQVTAAVLEDYCEAQSIMRFTSTATRDAALTTIKTNGMAAFTTDTSTLWLYDGTNWVRMAEPTQTWAIAFSGGITVGNGVWVGSYHRSDGWIDILARFTLGTTSAITGNLTINLPVAASFQTVNQLNAGANHAGTFYPLIPQDASPLPLLAINASGTYAAGSTISSTVPFTWATGDTVAVNGRYQMSTRYL